MDFIYNALLTLLALFVGWSGGTDTAPIPDTTVGVVETALVERVVDGDTIIVSMNGVSQRVRYIGIDTPELHGNDNEPECYAELAKERNAVLVDGQTVTLVPDLGDKDKYGRLLRYVYVDDVFVNKVLVMEGYAKKMYIKPDVAKYDLIKTAEQTARDNNTGLWSACAK